jgi:hypothetical protein
MNWLTQQLLSATIFNWISMIIQTITWPIAAVIVVRMFRGEVRLVLERMVRLRFQDFEAHFRAELSESENLLDKTETIPRLLDLPPDHPGIFHELNRGIPAVEKPSRQTAREQIESSWTHLVNRAQRYTGVGAEVVPQALCEQPGMDATGLLLFERLRQLYNQMKLKSEWSPSPEMAERFAQLSRRIEDRISK